MTARTDYIAHCERLGIHRSLAGLMADEIEKTYHATEYFSVRCTDAADQYLRSFHWGTSNFADFHNAVYELLCDMAKTGECK